MIIAIASGKGGTGKTTVAANLARRAGAPVQLVDCDVEEPNCHLFIQGEAQHEEVVTIPVPEVDEKLCDGCGDCGAFCQYHAIVSFGTKPLLFPEMCHGCGGCTLVCQKRAIREVPRRIGVIEFSRSGELELMEGRLDVGVAMAPPLIREVKARISDGLAVLDAPPGTSCPVIATLGGADVAALVTEPTPFGLHDLTLAVDMIRELAVPFGVVINRVGAGDDRVHRYCRDQGIPLLLEIPDDRRVAEAYSRGELMVDAVPEHAAGFDRLWERLRELAGSSPARAVGRSAS